MVDGTRWSWWVCGVRGVNKKSVVNKSINNSDERRSESVGSLRQAQMRRLY